MILRIALKPEKRRLRKKGKWGCGAPTTGSQSFSLVWGILGAANMGGTFQGNLTKVGRGNKEYGRWNAGKRGAKFCKKKIHVQSYT